MKSTTAIILILISVGLYYTVIGPQYANVQSLRALAAQYNDVLGNVPDLTSKRDTLDAKYKAIPAVEIDRLGKVLPDHVDTVKIARDFDIIAARYGISIKSLSTADAKTDNVSTLSLDGTPQAATPSQGAVPTLQKIAITMSFVATYPNFRKFLADLESSIRILDITDLSFQETDNGLNQYSLTLKTYWLK